VALAPGETVDALLPVRAALERRQLEAPLEKRLGRRTDECRVGLALTNQLFESGPMTAFVLDIDFDPRLHPTDQD